METTLPSVLKLCTYSIITFLIAFTGMVVVYRMAF